jgi:hypothetical protein
VLIVKNSSLTGNDVKNKSLGPADHNGSVHGATGPQRPKGDTGTPDTSNLFTKTESDGRFLAIAGKAADADKLDGVDSTQLRGARHLPNNPNPPQLAARRAARSPSPAPLATSP